jgi:intracellular septation protein
MTAPAAAPPNPLIKLALEMGPLVLFFITNARSDLFTATAVFMVAVLVSLVLSWMLTRRLPIMPVVSAVVVLVFGGLTLILHDELFIKLKPTIVNTLFGCVLLGGLAFGKSLLSHVLDTMIRMDAAGWRTLTLRWGVFFFFLAGLNEVVWRTMSTDFWVSFKVFGVMPITIAFALAQVPLMQRHTLPDDADIAASGAGEQHLHGK